MMNRFFSDTMLETLEASVSRKMICSRFPAEVQPIEDARHNIWAAEHSDSHSHMEVLVPLCGETLYGFNGEAYPCRPGIVMIFNPLEAHDSYYPGWSPDADHLWFHFSQDSILFRILYIREGMIQKLIPGGRLDIPSTLATYLRQGLMQQPDDPACPSPAMFRLRVEAIISILLFEVIQAGYRDEMHIDKDEFHRQIITTIERHIQETAGSGISLSSLARMSGYSPFHFERIFKQHTGHSVHRYIDECRINRVKEMLAEGRKMKQISDALGFSCPSAFSRWYKANLNKKIPVQSISGRSENS
ncbi:MAG: helix-turn-helix transcriptional regulator [bacterium]|nr:helix-turn-helix transcriptional regulator [bacterium]